MNADERRFVISASWRWIALRVSGAGANCIEQRDTSSLLMQEMRIRQPGRPERRELGSGERRAMEGAWVVFNILLEGIIFTRFINLLKDYLVFLYIFLHFENR